MPPSHPRTALRGDPYERSSDNVLDQTQDKFIRRRTGATNGEDQRAALDPKPVRGVRGLLRHGRYRFEPVLREPVALNLIKRVVVLAQAEPLLDVGQRLAQNEQEMILSLFRAHDAARSPHSRPS